MNSIVFTYVSTPTKVASRHDIALNRLAVWLDDEIGALEDLLDISGHEEAIDDIEALRGLYLEAPSSSSDTWCLLEGAQASLERLLKRVRMIPLGGPVPSDFDAWVCWSGAQLEDILTTLRQALAV